MKDLHFAIGAAIIFCIYIALIFGLAYSSGLHF